MCKAHSKVTHYYKTANTFSSRQGPRGYNTQASKQATLFAKIMKKYKYTVES